MLKLFTGKMIAFGSILLFTWQGIILIVNLLSI